MTSFVHDNLLDSIESLANDVGARTGREVSITPGRNAQRVDLLIEVRDKRIAVEAELTAKRIINDLTKARALHADELWIVVPNSTVANAVKRQLSRLGIRPKECRIYFLTLGKALQRLTNCFPLFPTPFVEDGKQKTKSKGTPREDQD